jgi:hypothetical protein
MADPRDQEAALRRAWQARVSLTSIRGVAWDMASVGKFLGLKRRGSRAALALLVLALGGCAGIGGSAAPPPTDPNVLPKDYRQQVAAFMRVFLDDPVKIRDAHISEPVLRPVGGATHYVSCVRYNPRSSQGQYEGNTERVALFLGGRLNQFLPASPELCRGVVYQRFPEAEVLVP